MKKIIFLLILLLPLRIYPQCRLFDGTDDTMTTGTGLPAWWQGAKAQVTIEFWLYLNETDRRHPGIFTLTLSEIVFGIEDGGGHNNTLESYMSGTTEGWYHSDGLELEADRWYHIALVYNGTTRTHYIDCRIDGTPVAETGSTDGQGATEFITLGDYGGVHTKGIIDELRVWNYGKTQIQLESGISKVIADEEPGLVGYWNMDEESGTLFNRNVDGSVLDFHTITGTLSVDNAPMKRIIGE